MTHQANLKRTVTKLTEGAQRSCSYKKVKPFTPCLRRAEYRVIVETTGSGKRKPHPRRLYYCAEHVPQQSPEEAYAAALPDGAISGQEAAGLIGIPVMTLHRWRGRGKGPKSTKVRGRCWYSRAEVERFAEAFRIVNGG